MKLYAPSLGYNGEPVNICSIAKFSINALIWFYNLLLWQFELKKSVLIQPTDHTDVNVSVRGDLIILVHFTKSSCFQFNKTFPSRRDRVERFIKSREQIT